MSDNVLTPKFRVSFPEVFRPKKAMEAGKEPKYEMTMLFAKGEDLTKLKAEAHRAGVEKWGPDTAQWPKNWRNPFNDQGSKEYLGYEPGAIYIKATSKTKPGLIDQKMQDIIEESKFYPGCYARATVRAFTYGGPGTTYKPGIGFGLQNIQKLADGEPLGGRTNPSQDFEPVASSEGATTAEALFG